jgi:hypothetical protein
MDKNPNRKSSFCEPWAEKTLTKHVEYKIPEEVEIEGESFL